MIKRKFKIGSVLVLVVGSAFLSWNWRNESKHSFKIRFEEIVDFGFEAFASNDWYNAEEILSSLFDKRGNELNLFRKMDRRRQLKARSLYGYLLFCKGNFKKSEMVWRPIFANPKAMDEFAASGEPRRKVISLYLRDLIELKKTKEILRILNLCYDGNGNPSEILRKFGDTALMRSMAGETFFRNAEYKKVSVILKAFFENPAMFAELNDRQKALVKWNYGKSLVCEGWSGNIEGKQCITDGKTCAAKVKIDSAEQKNDTSTENNVALAVLAPFFDENMKATKLFRELSEEDQVACRTTYALLLMKSNDHEKILRLLEVLFDENDKMLLQLKNPSEEAVIRNIYGYSLCRCGKYEKARRIWSRFFEEGDKEFMENFSPDEIDLLKAIRKNIHRLYVNNP
ncbi:MAG: hypothetical protein J5821_03695 [Alphaproteobacteria bacterium]|nr:hypothetical protein [Alphaproteobacteria bacterium]